MTPKPKPWAGLIGFAGLVLLGSSPILLLGLFARLNDPLRNSTWLYPVCLAEAAAYLTLSLLLIRYLHTLYRQILTKNGSPAPFPPVHRKLAAALLCLLLILAVPLGFEWLLQARHPGQTANQQALQHLIGSLPFLMGIHIILTAPLAEELIYRGILFNTLPHRLPTRRKLLPLFLSAGIFAALHSPSGLSFLPYFATGILLGGLYLYTRQLRYPVFVHAANNAMGFAALF